MNNDGAVREDELGPCLKELIEAYEEVYARAFGSKPTGLIERAVINNAELEYFSGRSPSPSTPSPSDMAYFGTVS